MRTAEDKLRYNRFVYTTSITTDMRIENIGLPSFRVMSSLHGSCMSISGKLNCRKLMQLWTRNCATSGDYSTVIYMLIATRDFYIYAHSEQ